MAQQTRLILLWLFCTVPATALAGAVAGPYSGGWDSVDQVDRHQVRERLDPFLGDRRGRWHPHHEIPNAPVVLEEAYLAPGASTWARALVTNQNTSGLSQGLLPKIVADSSGGVHVAYAMAGALAYAYRPPNYWQIAGLGPSSQIYADALAIDPAGTLRALFDSSSGYPQESLMYGEGCAGVSCLSTGSSCTQAADCCRGD